MDRQYNELKGDITLSTAQVKSIVETIQQLIEEVAAIPAIANKKREKKPIARRP